MEQGRPSDGHADTAGTGATRRPPKLLLGMVITTTAVGLGTLLGLVRDLLMAGYFGATGETDAFLVAWTLPETAVPLLIDGAMTLLMVPAFSRALHAREQRRSENDEDPVARLIAATLPRLTVALVVLAAAVALTAPWLVAVLAPGLADPALGVHAMRIISVSVVWVGLAGYLVAALRSHLVYGPPALVTVAMNVGIIGVMVAGHRHLGVLSAVIGAALGSALMVAVQLPSAVRKISWPRRIRRPRLGPRFGFSALAPIAVYIVARQAQVFVERFVASWLAPGTITHLNYVQKIAQVPSTLALSVAVVGFPALARAVAAGDDEQAGRRTRTDVAIVAAIVLAATVYLVAFAPTAVGALLQRGAFGEKDTQVVSTILRVYVLGLLGQALLDIQCRALFSARASWLPAIAMGIGLVLTAGAAAVGAPLWGASAVAAANAIGISATALIVVCARRDTVVSAGGIGMLLARLAPAVIVSAPLAYWAAAVSVPLPGLLSVTVGALVVGAVFAAMAVVTGGLPMPRRRSTARTSGREPT